jgi:hypothetical protein
MAEMKRPRDERAQTVQIGGPMLEHLKRTADIRGVSVGEVIADAVNLDNYLAETQREGGKVLIKSRSGTRELLSRDRKR